MPYLSVCEGSLDRHKLELSVFVAESKSSAHPNATHIKVRDGVIGNNSGVEFRHDNILNDQRPIANQGWNLVDVRWRMGRL